jgi:hypothetical protein
VSNERSREDVEEALSHQLLAIIASGEAYDRGEDWEAYRISTPVHTIVQDGNRRTRSLLTQLGIKESMLFASTSEGLIEGNAIPSPLIILDTDISRFIPLCWSEYSKVQKWLAFDEWWEEPIFVSYGLARFFGPGEKLARRELVYAMRSQDKGAHFDAEWRIAGYRSMAEGFDGSIQLNYPDGTSTPLRGANEAAMRQIGWELVASFGGQP